MAVIPITSASVIEQIRNLPVYCIETLSHSHAGRTSFLDLEVLDNISGEEFSSLEEYPTPISTRGKELTVLYTVVIYNTYKKMAH